MELKHVLQEAAAKSAALGYAGEVSPMQAWEYLSQDPKASLVDVRTTMEWRFVGLPDLAPLGKQTITVSWKLFPDFSPNLSFAEHLRGAGVDQETPLFFLCRTGGRSGAAAMAMTQEGFRYCFNITHGFEGDLNERNQRGKVNGWKASDLPWGQH